MVEEALARRYRVAVLATHPVYYQAPIFRRLSEIAEVVVYFCHDLGVDNSFDPEFARIIQWDVDLLRGYKYKWLWRVPFARPGSLASTFNPSIVWHLMRGQYDAIIVQGYTYPAAVFAFLGAWLRGTPVLLRGEADLVRPATGWRATVKDALLRPLLKRVQAVLYSCSANREYYRHYGVPEEKLFFCPCAVDNEFWQEQAEKFKPRRRELKEQYGIAGDSPVVLFVGKLIDHKRPLDLLRAFEGIYSECDASLVFIGDGPLRGELEREVKGRGLERVYFVGFKNQTELGPFYAMADVFVLSSDYDRSPKALNEAMNFGLPVIVTDRVGTAPDLVHHGVNGFIYPVGDVGALRRHLSELLEDSGRREHMGRRSLEIVSRWSFEEDVRGILKALDYVCSRRGSRDGRN